MLPDHDPGLLLHPVFVIVLVLTSARLTRLVTTDEIFAYPRLWASRWDWSRELVHCPWCIGFWIALAVAILLPAYWHVALVRVVALALSANYVTGQLEARA